MAVLMLIAVVRELLGFGSLFGIPFLSALMGEAFTPWTIMIMAPSAFFLVALVMWGAKTVQENMKIAAKAQQGGAK